MLDETSVMSISDLIFEKFRIVVIDLVIKAGLAVMVFLFGIKWLLSL